MSGRIAIWRPAAVLLIMATAAAASIAIRPERRLEAARSPFNLAAAVPERFADWHVDADDILILPSPELQAAVDRAYEQTVDRSYVDSAGHRVMLSIAVSGNYNKGMQWHRPENCYPSQGFLIDGATVPIEITTPLVTIAASQLVARRGRRVEPITYWFILGDQQARFGFDLRWHQVLYGLSGTIPDGLLVRVSSIDADAQHAFSVQQSFSRDLVTSIEEKERHRFLGDLAKLSGRAAGG